MVTLFALVVISLLFVCFAAGLVAGEMWDDARARQAEVTRRREEMARTEEFWAQERAAIRARSGRLF